MDEPTQLLLNENREELRNSEHKESIGQEMDSKYSLNQIPSPLISDVMSKFLSSKDLKSLKTTNRHFHGKNPNMRSYTFRYGCQASSYVFKTVRDRWLCDKDEYLDEYCTDDCSAISWNLACIIPATICSGVLALPTCFLGSMVGCIIDARNKFKSSQRQDPVEGFIHWSPMRQEMS